MNNKITVLLVEDRRADARLVEYALNSFPDADFDITTCTKLAAALHHLETQRPDLILADLNLPDSAGLESFRRINETSPTTPLVIMTAQTDNLLGVQAVDAGAQDFLVKGEIESQSLGRLLLQAIARQNLRHNMASQLQDVESSRNNRHNLVDLQTDGMLIINAGGDVVFANRLAEEMTGGTNSTPVHELLAALKDGNNSAPLIIRDKNGVKRELYAHVHPSALADDGSYMVLLDESSNAPGSLPPQTINTVDSITGLFSRQLFYKQAQLCLQNANSNDLTPAMLCINLDNFRRINEAMGHGSGDEILRLAGERIREQLRAGDIVGRFSGDEFLVLLAPLRRTTDASSVAAKVMRALAQPIEIWQSGLRISARTGISIYPQDGANVEDLVRHAQVAGQRAKQSSTSHIHYYTRELTEHSERRFNLEQQLRRALAEQQFDIAYQPIVKTDNGKLLGVEALLRWNTDNHEKIGPAEFVPVLEETGLIDEVGEWILRRACEQTRRWLDAGLDLRLSVNLSPLQFTSSGLPSTIAAALEESGLAATSLNLELTETVLMRNVEASVATLKALREKGVTVAIDDFGTGFSSLNYLKRFAIDSLKIDRSFIRDVLHDAHDAAITRATIDLARNLGLKVVAEGVEEAGQLEFLKQLGCDAFQGYYFSRPVPADMIPALCKKH